MGNEGYNNYYNDYALNVDEELMDDIQKELMIKKKKKSEKHFKKLVNKKLKGKIKKANFFDKFNKNEKGIKNVSQLLNLIYDQNTDRNCQRDVGRTFYEGVFGIKKISGLHPEKNFASLNNNFSNIVNLKKESNDEEVQNSFNENLNNNIQDAFDEENPYREYQNNIQENRNINNYDNLKAQNNIYNSNVNNSVQNFSNIIQYKSPNENIERKKFVRVSKIPNVEFIENNQFDLNEQNIPLDKDDINYNLKNSKIEENNFKIENNYNLNNNLDEINYNNNNNLYELNNSLNNNQNLNIYGSVNNIKLSESKYENNNNIIPYEVANKNYINNIDLINNNTPIYQKHQINAPIIRKTYKLTNNINNQNNDNSIAIVTKITEPHNTDENIQNQESNYDNELNDININKNKYNDIKEQQKLRYNLMTTNILNNKNEKEKIIYSKINNANKFIYKNEEEKNNNYNEINNKNNNIKIIEKTPKKDFEISKENDINYNSKSNNKTKSTIKNEINREISLDYSDLSKKSKSKSKSKEASNKKDNYEVSNENEFEVIRSKYPQDSQKKKENKIIKKNNIITNININNYPEKINVKNKTKKNIKKSVPKDKSKSKDKSKPKYSIQINLKDLINQDIQEKSKLSPDKRYADIETKRRTKNKANNKFKYNKPFRFNMNDDY